MAHRLSASARTALDDRYYVTTQSGSETIADRLIDQLTQRFFMLAQHPCVGRARDEDLCPGLHTFPVGMSIIVYRVVDEEVWILFVTHGDRDIAALLPEDV